jgi:orotidine-5'-phosphate decarboxylase
MSFDLLQEKIIALKNPTVAGLDPRPEYVPSFIRERFKKECGAALRAEAEAIYEFNCGLMDALSGLVPALKPQSAFYERLGVPGISTLEKTLRYAREKGFYVIGDMKRGDIGSTAEAYSDAYLGIVAVDGNEYEPFPCDALTVNAYLGSDGLKPFLHACKTRGKAIFALVKTSNPSSGELQDRLLDGRPVYEAVGSLIESLGRGLEGVYGFTPIGAVAGATYPDQLRQLRALLPEPFSSCPATAHRAGRRRSLPRLPEGRARRSRELLPRHHLRLAKNREGRQGLSGGRAERRAQHAGRHRPFCHDGMILQSLETEGKQKWRKYRRKSASAAAPPWS